jgi:tetratricopeptide (TPR) repeat protein
MFCYELTTHFNPGCAEAWNNLGVLYKEADNLERAAECYMSALNTRPNFPQVWLSCCDQAEDLHSSGG